MVRIRHSCGTSRNAVSNVADVDARVLDQRRDFVEQVLVLAEAARPAFAASRCSCSLDLAPCAWRSRRPPCLRRAASPRSRPRCASAMSPLPMKRWPRVRVAGCRPSTLPGTTRAPCSMTRPCTGRTNCASPCAPAHHLRDRQLLERLARRSPASTCVERCAAGVDAWRRTLRPSASRAAASASTATPCFFAKPATACRRRARPDGPSTSRSSRSRRASRTLGNQHRQAARRGERVLRSPSAATQAARRPDSSTMPSANARRARAAPSAAAPR